MLNNLSSDKLRRQLDENNAAMNTLAEDNQKIVELLAQRGLKVIEKIAEDRMPLTTEELNAGGWWCDDTSEYCRLALSNKGIAIKSQSWDGRYSFCFMRSGRVYRGLPGEKSRVICSEKQIRRIGSHFYWGAP